MQIHDLNDFVGALGAGVYLPVDNGLDTGKLSFADLFAADSYETLWTGTICDAGDSATLSKDVSEFDFIDIYVTGRDWKSIRVPVSFLSDPVMIGSIHFPTPGPSGYPNLYLIRTGLSISGTTASVSSCTQFHIAGTTTYTQPNFSGSVVNSPIAITRIDGIKTPGNSKGVVKIASVQLKAADWSSSKQTVTVEGVTATNSVLVCAAPGSQTAFMGAGVYCSSQSADALEFTCGSTPSVDLDVNVMIVG